MKKETHPRRTTRRSCKSALAASFVVTFAAHGAAGCKKQPVESGDPPEPPRPRVSSASISPSPFGDCHLYENPSCPPNVTCNPPPPIVIDCPPDMRDAAEPAVTRRPPGKEDWLRVKPRLWVSNQTTCMFEADYFCAPPGKPWECTERPKAISVPCTTDDAGTTRKLESFVYKDGLGVCRKVPATECTAGVRGSCEDLPEGEVVPCA